MKPMKISNEYKPEEWTFVKEIAEDGSITLRFDNGAIFKAPPLPPPEVQERWSRRLCEINYQILERIAREKMAAEEEKGEASVQGD